MQLFGRWYLRTVSRPRQLHGQLEMDHLIFHPTGQSSAHSAFQLFTEFQPLAALHRGVSALNRGIMRVSQIESSVKATALQMDLFALA